MNTLLTKHVEREEGKTQAESVAAYTTAWENSRYLLRPLMLMLEEQIRIQGLVKETDFDVPNHYAKLMFQQGKKDEAELIRSMLPKSLTE